MEADAKAEHEVKGEESVDGIPTHAGPVRPKWLSAVAISAIALGSLFGCCGLASIGGLLMSETMNSAFTRAQQTKDANPRMARAQREMMERGAEFGTRVLPLTATSGVISLVHAFGLIVAGLSAYRARAFGRRLLVALCVAGIAVELGTGAIGLYVTVEQNAMMAPLMDEMMKSVVPKGQPTEQGVRAQRVAQGIMSKAFQAGTVFSWLTVIGFFLVKSAYYIACALYLRRDEVVKFCGQPSTVAA